MTRRRGLEEIPGMDKEFVADVRRKFLKGESLSSGEFNHLYQIAHEAKSDSRYESLLGKYLPKELLPAV